MRKERLCDVPLLGRKDGMGTSSDTDGLRFPVHCFGRLSEQSFCDISSTRPATDLNCWLGRIPRQARKSEKPVYDGMGTPSARKAARRPNNSWRRVNRSC